MYSAHEGRFDANPASGFCGGTVGPTSSVVSPMFTRVGTAGTFAGASTQSAFARTSGFAEARYCFSAEPK